MVISRIKELNLLNKRAFLRVDLNLPIVNGKIFSDFKLQAILPTLDLLIQEKSSVILATHLGRPEGFDKKLSTEIFVSWFKDKHYDIKFCPELDLAKLESKMLKPGQMLLLENLRFYPEEKTGDIAFAQKLKELADFYVNDAFGLLHRHDTSITKLPKLYDYEHKSVGLLIEKEITILSKIKDNPIKPFTIIQGGGKVGDKIPFLEHLLDKVDNILIGPAVSFTFLKALSQETGLSLIDSGAIEKAQEVMDLAKAKNVNLVLPLDYQVYNNKFGGKLIYTDKIEPNQIGISIGPKTLELFKKIIDKSKTIFLNGSMGLDEHPETLENFISLLKIIADSPTYSVVGGGDSGSLVYNNHLENKISFCSTGGGATLLFLSGQELPGLKYVIAQPLLAEQ